MKPLLLFWGLVATGMLCGGPWILAGADVEEAAPPDKSVYNLFHPTPREFMREMSTDRPDKTESPYTVDAGHFQFEMDLVTYAYDRSGPDTDVWSVAPINLKLGLLNNVDFQVVLRPFTQVRVSDSSTGTTKTRSGFGDVTTRLKVNLWGNDGGRTSLALMPFAVFPSGQDNLGGGDFGGGLIVPMEVALPLGWSLVAMTAVEFLRGDDGADPQGAFVNSITFGHTLVGKLAGYVEFFSEVSTERDARWVGTVDLGLTYGLTDDIQLDAGINIGVTKSAEDLNPFVGLSWRF